MEQHSNSAHEGTNSAVKNCGDGLHVNDSLVSATKKCSSYDRKRFVQRYLDVAKQYHNFNSYNGPFWEMDKRIDGKIERYLEEEDNPNSSPEVQQQLYMSNKAVKKLPTKMLFENMAENGKICSVKVNLHSQLPTYCM